MSRSATAASFGLPNLDLRHSSGGYDLHLHDLFVLGAEPLYSTVRIREFKRGGTHILLEKPVGREGQGLTALENDLRRTNLRPGKDGPQFPANRWYCARGVHWNIFGVADETARKIAQGCIWRFRVGWDANPTTTFGPICSYLRPTELLVPLIFPPLTFCNLEVLVVDDIVVEPWADLQVHFSGLELSTPL